MSLLAQMRGPGMFAFAAAWRLAEFTRHSGAHQSPCFLRQGALSSSSEYGPATVRMQRLIGSPQDLPDLDSAKVRAKSLFSTLEMPQAPDGLRIVDSNGAEVFAWR